MTFAASRRSRSRLVAATALVALLAAAPLAYAEQPCGSIDVDVVPPPSPAGAAFNDCNTAWATCGFMTLTVSQGRVTRVDRWVSQPQRAGDQVQMVPTTDCSTAAGTCAWMGEPKIIVGAEQTTITAGLKNWRKREDDPGTFRRANLVAYCQ